MPLRSLTSSVFAWPKAADVEAAVRAWAALEVRRRPDLIAIGYYGSYARGDHGVGSDLDVVAVVERAEEAFERRALGWDLLDLPIPTQILVYTAAEW